jgi:prepilin-type N-terminal cleavage/methylation domain-containing protein
MKTINKKGFTLIELLIVIGILAVLSTATVLMLNPAQMLAESRDTQRMNDLNTLSTAISLMQATATTCNSLGGNTSSGVGSACSLTAVPASACGAGHWGSSTAAANPVRLMGTLADAAPLYTARTITGSGWMMATLNGIGGGAPISTLPIDPANTVANNYQYACDANSKYELDVHLESEKYTNATTGKEATDGGTSATAYETGSTLAL